MTDRQNPRPGIFLLSIRATRNAYTIPLSTAPKAKYSVATMECVK